MLLLLLFVAFDISNSIHYLTRFTFEIFAVLSPLVLLGYGFVYFCRMLKHYADMPGTFVNQSCQCIQYMKPVNTTLYRTSTMLSNLTILFNGTNSSVEPVAIVMNVHFRDCKTNGWELVGDACLHDVYPFALLVTLSAIAGAKLLSFFQHFGYLPSQVCYFV